MIVPTNKDYYDEDPEGDEARTSSPGRECGLKNRKRSAAARMGQTRCWLRDWAEGCLERTGTARAPTPVEFGMRKASLALKQEGDKATKALTMMNMPDSDLEGSLNRSMSHLVMRARREPATAGSSGLRMIVGHYCCRRAARRQWHHLFCAIMSNYRKFEVKSRSVTFSLPDAGVGLRMHNDFMWNCSSTHVLVQLLYFLISVLLRA